MRNKAIRIDRVQFRLSLCAYNFLKQMSREEGISLKDKLNKILFKYFKGEEKDINNLEEFLRKHLRKAQWEWDLSSRKLFDKILTESYPDKFFNNEYKFLLSFSVVEKTYKSIKIIEKLFGESIDSLAEMAFDKLFEEDEAYKKALETHLDK